MLEKMGDFFDNRLSEYDNHQMTCIDSAEEFYLFTDTTCNYGFYEHQGMIRRLEKEHTFHIKGQQRVMNFFIYDSSTQKKMSE